MTDSPPLAPVITLRAAAAPPALRGWHGMIERSHAQYSPADWMAWGTVDPTGNARIVDVAPWSPAASAGVVSGDWILSLNGERLDTFDRRGALVGTRVRVTVHRLGIAPWIADLVLMPPPARTRRERLPLPAYPQVACGRRLGAKQRLQWRHGVKKKSARCTYIRTNQGFARGIDRHRQCHEPPPA